MRSDFNRPHATHFLRTRINSNKSLYYLQISLTGNTFHIPIIDDLVRIERWFRKKLQMQGAQKLRSEAHLQMRRNDEVAAQRRRWTFYETIKFLLPPFLKNTPARGTEDPPPLSGAG